MVSSRIFFIKIKQCVFKPNENSEMFYNTVKYTLFCYLIVVQYRIPDNCLYIHKKIDNNKL